MKAADIMTTSIITIGPNARVSDVAEKLFAHGISAVPVVGGDGKLIGIVSEGDLVRIAEVEIEPRRRSWWLRLPAGKETLATELTKAKARTVSDVMTRNVITAEPDTPASHIAASLDRHAIKRVPIVKDGQVVGIVSRANLLKAVVTVVKKGDKGLAWG